MVLERLASCAGQADPGRTSAAADVLSAGDVADALVSQTRYNLLASVRAGAAIAVGIVMPVVSHLGASALFGSDAMGGDAPVDVRWTLAAIAVVALPSWGSCR